MGEGSRPGEAEKKRVRGELDSAQSGSSFPPPRLPSMLDLAALSGRSNPHPAPTQCFPQSTPFPPPKSSQRRGSYNPSFLKRKDMKGEPRAAPRSPPHLRPSTKADSLPFPEGDPGVGGAVREQPRRVLWGLGAAGPFWEAHWRRGEEGLPAYQG